MGNYSDKGNSVRVDFFKESGKWYLTEAVLWHTYKGSGEDGMLIHTAFAEALRTHLIQPDFKLRLNGMTAICLEPYHEHAHPITFKVQNIFDELFHHRAITRANRRIGAYPVESTILCPKCGGPMNLETDADDLVNAFCPACVWRGIWTRHGISMGVREK